MRVEQETGLVYRSGGIGAVTGALALECSREWGATEGRGGVFDSYEAHQQDDKEQQHRHK